MNVYQIEKFREYFKMSKKVTKFYFLKSRGPPIFVFVVFLLDGVTRHRVLNFYQCLKKKKCVFCLHLCFWCFIEASKFQFTFDYDNFVHMPQIFNIFTDLIRKSNIKQAPIVYTSIYQTHTPYTVYPICA